MNLKVILEIISMCVAVLTVYPTVLWYIGREDRNKSMMDKYKWKMIIGICISVVFYIASLKV